MPKVIFFFGGGKISMQSFHSYKWRSTFLIQKKNVGKRKCLSSYKGCLPNFWNSPMCDNLWKQNNITIQYNTIEQYNTIQYNTIQYNAIQYTKKLIHKYYYILFYKGCTQNPRSCIIRCETDHLSDLGLDKKKLLQ